MPEEGPSVREEPVEEPKAPVVPVGGEDTDVAGEVSSVGGQEEPVPAHRSEEPRAGRPAPALLKEDVRTQESEQQYPQEV